MAILVLTEVLAVLISEALLKVWIIGSTSSIHLFVNQHSGVE